MPSKMSGSTPMDSELAERYYRKGTQPAESVVLAFLRDSPMIVHGGQALNAHLPDWLDKETKDWDIFTKGNAKEQAKSLESKLDRRYGGDYFSVEPAAHPGTFKIKSKVTGETVADITLQDKTVSFRRIENVNYVTLDYLEADAEMLLANPDNAYRAKKDKDTLQRIAVCKATKSKGRAPGNGRKGAVRKQRARGGYEGLGSMDRTRYIDE